jgi:alanine dehydrogenase
VIVTLLRESRPGERRVLLLPEDAARLREICDLHVETGAGHGLGIPDDAYAQAGARITSGGQAWASADLLLKLKAPTVAEVGRIRHGGSIAALFHAEGTPDVVAGLLARDITAYSFEYFQDEDGTFPLMTATGEIAGQMAVVYAAYHLQSHLDGSGSPSPPARTLRPPVSRSSDTATPDGQPLRLRWRRARTSPSTPGTGHPAASSPPAPHRSSSR